MKKKKKKIKSHNVSAIMLMAYKAGQMEILFYLSQFIGIKRIDIFHRDELQRFIEWCKNRVDRKNIKCKSLR